MPARRLSIRKIKEVLRLKHELGRGHRQIARSCSIGLGTVHDYLARADNAELSGALPSGYDDEQLESLLFGSTPRRQRQPERPVPDFAAFHEQRQKHKHLTLQLRCNEYRGVTRRDPTLAEGIVDRLVHNARRIDMKGDSMRKDKPPKPYVDKPER